jgi:hypothetical protein
VTDIEPPKLAQLDKALHKWSTATRSKGNPVTECMRIYEDMCFYDEMKISDKCIFPENWLQNLGTV